MKVRFSEEATRYVERERAYLAQFGRRIAVAFSEQIKKAARLLGEHPRVGVVVAPADGVRRFVTAPYHLDYILREDHIVIVSIMHARQGPADLEKDADLDEGA
ncbi:type II toxin-antitoxin system RelE/ParE family toxin [Pseudorhizobium endolithicum]|uniref:Type II toxin-antitoxin system RelE/ParE family toxin n=1 Tax=Pseudorhizobium endolithicum TaxID=1191678 RepID=A0ABM8PFQ9_9HYPH|nr:type II toxin-antitoxin system RelE/ParE family toxin [Pseudorhizobium endolithicum]CAD7027336.1 type II toxin-antitoxin system RelE/ParE family toxin [Pseudorhizobium endolithicum]